MKINYVKYGSKWHNWQKKKQKWFEAKTNSFVYASGLPQDITQEELKEFFTKCGVIMLDPNTGQLKIKIYTDDTGVPKGDARICYANVESVQMAVEWLNESEIRPGFPVHVEQATFAMKGEVYKPRQAQKIDKVEKMRIRAQVEKQKAWDDHELEQGGLKVVILEGFYTLEEIYQAEK